MKCQGVSIEGMPIYKTMSRTFYDTECALCPSACLSVSLPLSESVFLHFLWKVVGGGAEKAKSFQTFTLVIFVPLQTVQSCCFVL